MKTNKKEYIEDFHEHRERLKDRIREYNNGLWYNTIST